MAGPGVVIRGTGWWWVGRKDGLRDDPITLTLGASHLDLSREAGEVI
jgi:hypothetical protein